MVKTLPLEEGMADPATGAGAVAIGAVDPVDALAGAAFSAQAWAQATRAPPRKSRADTRPARVCRRLRERDAARRRFIK